MKRKKAIKGAILLLGFIFVILGLFFASETGKIQASEFYMNCVDVNGELVCALDS